MQKGIRFIVGIDCFECIPKCMLFDLGLFHGKP